MIGGDTQPSGSRALAPASAASAAEIRARVKHLEDFTAKKETGVPHGAGAGGGWMRDCPVVTKDTRVVGSDVEGGSRILVHPNDAAALQSLRAETRRRQTALSQRAADGG